MNRKNFIQALTLMGISAPLWGSVKHKKRTHIQLIRHATIILTMDNVKLLIDPMLSAKDAMDPVQNCGNTTRIPMVDLPFSQQKLDLMLDETDAVFLTHLHRDHWDQEAQQRISKYKPIFCQPSDLSKIKEQGFTNITPVDSELVFKNIRISRTGGKHGTGEIGQKMGIVSGYVFSHRNDTIYVTGDTIWCEEVKTALNQHKPTITIVNTGGARFLTGDPITMTPDDIFKVHETLPQTQLIAVHMDTVNHCFIKRSDLKAQLAAKKQMFNLLIPEDGEILPK